MSQTKINKKENTQTLLDLFPVALGYATVDEEPIGSRAGRNRTITLSSSQIDLYAGKCLTENDVIQSNSLLGNIVYGDSLSVLDRIKEKFIDLLIVDPPYNLYKNYGDSTFKKMSDEGYFVFTEKWIKTILPLLNDNASVYVCCDWKSSTTIGSVLQKYFTIQNRITWQREKGRGAKKNWKNSMEDIWYCTVSPTDYIFNLDSVKIRRRVIAPYRVGGVPKDWTESEYGNFRDTCPSNFWDDISIPYWSMPENTDHSTQKPEKLIAKLILASSNKNSVIFDPFLGSGTTAVVAKKLGRIYSGIEIEKEYCALTQKRLEMAETDKRIQGYTDGIFWERNTLGVQKKIGK
jgi:site-specific DNA-methyltransferase (adenine-specific)